MKRAAAILIGLVFLAAGVLKARDPASFAIDVYHYRLLPWMGSALLALYLPWLEIVCGGALILRLGFRGALCIGTVLMAVFLAAYGSARLRGLDIACGCFGHEVHRGPAWVLVPDALLLAALLWLLQAEMSGAKVWRQGETVPK